jgi:group I intron endonuclease
VIDVTKQRKRVGIYAIFKCGTEDCYVGQSIDIDGRWHRHIKSLINKHHHSIYLQRVFNKYGEDALSFQVLEVLHEEIDKHVLTIAEQKWMDLLKPRYNMCPAAASPLGFHHSAATRQKISKAKTGQPSFWRGKTPTEETRLKMSVAKKGKPSTFKGRCHTPESLARISTAKNGCVSPNKGKTCSEEAKLKQSLSMRGRPSPTKGIPHTQETKEKMRLSALKRYERPEEREKAVHAGKLGAASRWHNQISYEGAAMS